MKKYTKIQFDLVRFDSEDVMLNASNAGYGAEVSYDQLKLKAAGTMYQAAIKLTE